MHEITTATTVEESQRAARVAVLPIGSFEQHGPHLPLTTDTLVAATIAHAIAAAYDVLLLPPITISCSQEHTGWAGTVSITACTLIAVIGDVAESLRRSRIEHLVLVNGHGGNYVLANIVQEANVTGARMALFPSRDNWATARKHAQLTSTAHEDMHAGELETSLLLHACPELVRDGYQSADHITDRPHLLVFGLRAYTTTGVVGLPSHATSEKGKALLDSLTDSFGATLAVLNADSMNDPQASSDSRLRPAP